jgi:uncharacterized membrane protein YgcG
MVISRKTRKLPRVYPSISISREGAKMNAPRRSAILVLALLLTVMGAFGLRSTAGQNDQAPPVQSFIKIGNYYIRVNTIDYATVTDESIVVVFQGQGQLTLSGTDASRMKSWLTAQSGPPSARSNNDMGIQGAGGGLGGGGFVGGLGGGAIGGGGSLGGGVPSNAAQGQRSSSAPEPFGNEGFRNYYKRKQQELLEQILELEGKIHGFSRNPND